MADRGPSVIHDIGYRGYDGERLGRGAIARSLVADTVRGAFGLGRPARAKIMPWVLVFFISTPVLINAFAIFILGQFVDAAGPNDLIVDYRSYPVGVAFMVVMFVAGRAPNAVSRDIRDGVMPLYFSRPLARNDYVWAKFAGVALSVFAVIAGCQTLLLIVRLLADLPAGPEFVAWAAGLVVAALVATLAAGIGLALATFAPGRGRGVAVIVTYFILIFGISTTIAEIAISRGSETLGNYLAGLNPFALANGVGAALLGGDGLAGPHYPDGVAGGLAFLGLALLTVAACLGFLLRRYRRIGGL